MTDAVDTAAHAMGFMLADMLNSDGPIDMDALSRAALTAVLDAVTLEWEYSGPQRFYTYTASPFRHCDYWVNQEFTTDAWWFTTMRHDGVQLYDGEDLPAAQAAALADYRARLAGALGFTPASADRASDPTP